MSEALAAAALRLDKVARIYAEGMGTLEVFRNISLSLKQGEVVALVGQSGAGKSSLLHMAGLLEAPSSGEVVIGGTAASTLPDAERTRLRRDTIGFVYQAHHLLPEFSALENVILPQLIAGKPKAVADAEARRLLDLMGLSQRLTHRPAQLSGGEQQRVAIARAFAGPPKLLFADEPTGNLDSATGEEIANLMFDLNREHNTTLLLVTHDERLASRCGRRLRLAAGKLLNGHRD